MKKIIIAILLFTSAGCMGSSSKFIGSEMGIKHQETVEAFGLRVARIHGHKYLLQGTSSMVDQDRSCWPISLSDERKVTIEDAREMIVNIFNDYWKEISTNPIFQNYKDKMNRLYPNDYPYEVVTADIGIKLSFWDKDVNRPLRPFVAQVKVAEDKVYYYYADPETQALGEPIIETVTEARQKSSSN